MKRVIVVVALAVALAVATAEPVAAYPDPGGPSANPKFDPPGDPVKEQEGVILSVPLYAQEHNLSCEAAATRMVLAHFGINRDEQEILKLLGRDPNPHKGFRGDVDGVLGFENYGVYAEPVARVFRNLGLQAQVRYRTSYDEIRTSLNSGNVVIVWLSKRDNPPVREEKTYRLILGEHVVVIVGYDSTGFWVNDPWKGRHYHIVEIKNWYLFGRMAVLVKPQTRPTPQLPEF